MGFKAMCALLLVCSGLAQAQGIANPAVIAHRGASFDAPESSAPAYVLARELGVDYLELDLQRSRDGVLVVVHDDTLLRTSDVAQRFPERKNSPVSAFSLAELKSLDVGSWFNQANPERARPAFVGLKLQTLDEVLDIAEGNPAKAPGVYIETKVPKLFPGIEADLQRALNQRGWLDTPGRVVLQSFDRNSLALLHNEMPQVPKVLLLWAGRGERPLPDKAEYERWLGHAKAAGAIGVGPSAGANYADLAQPWMNRLSHEQGLLVHVYTLDALDDFKKASEAGVDGIFTNRSSALLRFYGRPVVADESALLTGQGF